MTGRAFSQALRRGLGGAIVELKNAEDKTAYRETVLRCCLRDISFDRQSEGTKGYYLYDAMAASGEPEYYEEKIIEKFLLRCSDGLFFQLAAILCRFADDGSEPAKQALCSKYDDFASKRRLGKTASANEGAQWDEVAYHLMYLDGFAAFKRYAADVGAMLLRRPGDRTAYDDWFIARAEGAFGKKRIDAFFDAASEKSAAVRALADNLKAEADSRERSEAQARQEKIAVGDLLRLAAEAAAGEKPRYRMARPGRRFFAKASDSEMLDLAHAVLRQEDETVKALLLNLFRLRPFPLGISPLMEYARSENELLAQAAIGRLEEVKDRRLHDLAVQLLERKGLGSFALALLKENYRKADDAVIAELIGKSAAVPHHVQQDVVDIYCRHRSANAFPILLRVYRKGDCGFCRFGIVQAMHHCGVLPDDILADCLCDSYGETRDFATRLIRRRALRRTDSKQIDFETA